MAVPESKSALLAAINETFEKLVADLATIPVDAVLEKSLDGHAGDTRMSVHDLVSYLLGWNELVLKWHEKRRAGETVDFPETGFKWNELGLLAQKFYRDHADVPFPSLLNRLADAKARIVKLVEGYGDEALYGASWYDTYTMGRMIQFNTSSPYVNARARLRRWKKEKGIV